VSLRKDVHVAIDELAPSTSGMSDRVINEMLGEVRRRRRLRVKRLFDVPLSLVAMVLILSTVIGVLAGGKLMSDWEAFVRGRSPAGVDVKVLQSLEARPFRQPLVNAGDQCSGGPWDPATGWWGGGPVYVHSLISSGYASVGYSGWGIYATFHAETEQGATGPVLIRGRDLVTGDRLVFVGRFAAGQLVGVDTLAGTSFRQYSELLLDADHPTAAPSAGFVQWNFTVGVKVHIPPTPGNLVTLPPTTCTGWQIDGPAFSEIFEVPI
jgi:hypothetical protein